jgi:hypothetical protein
VSIPPYDGHPSSGYIGCIVLLVIALSCCSADSHRTGKTTSASYFAKKIECQKYEAELVKDMEKEKFYGQYLERIFYSPSLDTCVAIIYRLPNSGNGKIQAEVRDVLTERVLWFAEYPMDGGAGHKSYEEIIADADAEIQRKGWGEK